MCRWQRRERGSTNTAISTWLTFQPIRATATPNEYGKTGQGYLRLPRWLLRRFAPQLAVTQHLLHRPQIVHSVNLLDDLQDLPQCVSVAVSEAGSLTTLLGDFADNVGNCPGGGWRVACEPADIVCVFRVAASTSCVC